ncbi:GNAT family N-acetyltransferase [Dactylosporangium sp. NPDC049742]|uniref:GNAT family N-acetyltransferase n=1 Tax=Dactylosporangium sp. NPDC049742 TaxID=3154737 RepID=UPI003423F99C
MTQVSIELDDRGRYLDDAAQVWAEGTAARDGTEVAPLELARVPLQTVLSSSPRTMLVVALGERVVGFSLIAPHTERTAAVRYLGVRPDGWGAGVGRQLMTALPPLLAAAGFADAELDVYVDNPRAIRLYERLGWQPLGDPAPHPRNGRIEQRYRLDLPS